MPLSFGPICYPALGTDTLSWPPRYELDSHGNLCLSHPNFSYCYHCQLTHLYPMLDIICEVRDHITHLCLLSTLQCLAKKRQSIIIFQQISHNRMPQEHQTTSPKHHTTGKKVQNMHPVSQMYHLLYEGKHLKSV